MNEGTRQRALSRVCVSQIARIWRRSRAEPGFVPWSRGATRQGRRGRQPAPELTFGGRILTIKGTRRPSQSESRR